MTLDDIFTAPDGRTRAIWRAAAGGAVFVFAEHIARIAAWAVRGTGFLASNTISRILFMFLLIAGFAFLLRVLDRVQSPPLPAMGLPLRSPAVRDSVLGILLGAGLTTLAAAAIGVRGDLAIKIDFRPGTLPRIFLVLSLLMVAAMTEELAFRGYPFQRLVESMGGLLAVLLTSGVFALAHMRNPHATVFGGINTAMVGALLALAYLKTKSLWLPWGIHFGWNAMLGFVLGLPVSGFRDFAVLTKSTTTGPLWLTGGDYGIEASATGTVVIAVGIVILAAFVRSRPATPVVLAADQPPISIEPGHEEPSGRIQ